MRKRNILTLALLLSAAVVSAAPRNKVGMAEAAAKAIAALNDGQQGNTRHRAPQSAVRELLTTDELSVYGEQDGAFAIVTADDLFPEVIGVSSAGFSTDNPGVQWYLAAAREAIADAKARGTAIRRVAPDVSKFPASVEPMLKTHWGQSTPYKNLCPRGSEGDNLVTGCVATAMSQVLAYYRLPLRGKGQRTVYYPKDDPTGQKLTANFAETVYDYENMLDVYRDVDYTDEQAQAVATLMMHCGVATDMRYGETGSAAVYADAVVGLRDYFGFKNVRDVKRASYSDTRWMEMIFEELSNGAPILYGAGNGSYGHSFIFHGYNAEGMVYVNWGWDGEADGYYDIDLLKPRFNEAAFTNNQGMVIGFRTYQPDVPTITVNLATPGTLAQQLDASRTYGEIKVVGKMNAADLEALRTRINSARDDSYLFAADTYSIDLSEAEFDNNALPEKAFYGCTNLRCLKLPKALASIGAGAFGGCEALTELEGQGTDYVCDGNLVFNGNRTRLIAVLADAIGTVVIPEGVTEIGDYAFTSLRGAVKIDLPSTLTNIGTGVFTANGVLAELWIRAEAAPKLADRNVFSGITQSTILYVHAPSLATYKKASRYSSFSNIRAYGTLVKASDTTREFGQENPKFGYTIEGDNVAGEPELICEATPESPVGTYEIKCLRGTITADDVTCVSGTLYVTEAAAIRALTADDKPFDIYDTDGRLLVRGAKTIAGLKKGVYVIGGQKLIVR